jgi:rare lipoprotein A
MTKQMPAAVDNFIMKTHILVLLIFCLGALCAWADQWGLASWYGGDFHGKKTANGELFDTNQHTAAHNSLPFNTLVKVTNLYNQKTTIVRINDRGPFKKGRIIDLSHAAAEELGMLDSGVVPVRVEVVKNTEQEGKPAHADNAADTGNTDNIGPGDKPASAENNLVCRIQVGAFKQAENAERTKRIIVEKNLKVAIESTKTGFYRVYVDQVPKNSLDRTKKILHDLGFHDFIVKEEQL